MSDYTQILYDVDDGIATITLHRPEKMNAFTNVMMNEMIAAFDEIDADDDVRVVRSDDLLGGSCVENV